MNDCVFCKIVKKIIPVDFIYQDGLVAAFNDANPLSPAHVLIIPKRHIPSINDLKEDDEELAGRMIMVAQKIAKSLNISEKGYKLLIRVGKHGGQEISHVHLHLLGGAQLAENITNS